MTLDELLRMLVRRWYVVLLGLAATLAAAVLLTRPSALYWTQTDVVFVAPGGDVAGVTGGDVSGLVDVAAVVERRVNGGQVERLASASAPLYGVGVRAGYSVVLPNVGGQWTNSFSRPVLSVEAVGSTPEEVLRYRAEALDLVEEVALQTQQELGVSRAEVVEPVAVTGDPVIAYVGSTLRSRARAVLGYSVLGASGTFLLAWAIERRRDRRARPRQGVTASVAQPAAV